MRDLPEPTSSDDMSQINDQDIPLLGGPDPDFTVMGNSDGRFVHPDPNVDHTNKRHY